MNKEDMQTVFRSDQQFACLFVYKITLKMIKTVKIQLRSRKKLSDLNTKKLTNVHLYTLKTLMFWCFLLNLEVILCKY